MMHLLSIAYYSFLRLKVGGQTWIPDPADNLLGAPILYLFSIIISLDIGISCSIRISTTSILLTFIILIVCILFEIYLSIFFEKKKKETSFVNKYEVLGKKYASWVYFIYAMSVISLFLFPIIALIKCKYLS